MPSQPLRPADVLDDAVHFVIDRAARFRSTHSFFRSSVRTKLATALTNLLDAALFELLLLIMTIAKRRR
jgi:hypothetical protein